MGIQNLAQGVRARMKKGCHTFNGPLRTTLAAAVDDERQYKMAGEVSLENLREFHETLHRPLVHVQQRGDKWRARIRRGGEYHFGPYRSERKVAESDARRLLQSGPRAAGGQLQEPRGAELVDRRSEGFEAVVRLHFQFLLLGNFSGMSQTEQRRLRRARQEDKYNAAFKACELLVEDKRAIEKLALQHDASWMHKLGEHFCLDYGSRPLGTGGFDVPSGQCGLCNLGNSCWLNATVQCLLHCSPLQKELSGSEAARGPLRQLLRELFDSMCSKQWDYVAPFKVLNQMYKTWAGLFKPGESADAGDCCAKLLETCMISNEVGGQFFLFL